MVASAKDAGWRALFWTVFARSRNAMLLLDANRRILAANQAMLDLIGYSHEQVVGRRIDLFLEPDEWKSLDSEWQAFRLRGEFLGERCMVRADGRLARLHYAARWALVGRDSVVLYVALESDVTPPRVVDADDLDGTSRPLSPRELEVISEVAMGLRAHEIADELGIAPSTVRTHLRNAMKAVGARSQAQLVAIAFERGLIHPRAVATAGARQI